MSTLHELVDFEPGDLTDLPFNVDLEDWAAGWEETVRAAKAADSRPLTRTTRISVDRNRAEQECSFQAEEAEPALGEERMIWRVSKEQDGYHVTGLTLAALREVSE